MPLQIAMVRFHYVKLFRLYSGKLVEKKILLDDGLDSALPRLAHKAYDAGLVGRDIELLFMGNCVRAVRRSDGAVLDADILESVVEEYIEDRKARESFVLT